jgi:hypothetical protein
MLVPRRTLRRRPVTSSEGPPTFDPNGLPLDEHSVRYVRKGTRCGAEQKWMSIDVKRLCGFGVSKLQIEHCFSKICNERGGALRAIAFCRQRVKLPAARRPSLAGQYQLKDRTPSDVAGRPQAAPMRFDDPPTDRQSHAGALRFGGEECVENALGLIDRKPGA